MTQPTASTCSQCKHFEGCKGQFACIGFVSKGGIYWRESDIQEAIAEIEEIEQGQKHDQGKPDWHCVPLDFIELFIPVFRAGIEKGYGRFNCLRPFAGSDHRFFSGAMRHTKACQIDPLAIDEETGCFHGVQAAFNHLARVYHAKKEADI